MTYKLINNRYVVTYNGRTTSYSKFTWNLCWFFVGFISFLSGLLLGVIIATK